MHRNRRSWQWVATVVVLVVELVAVGTTSVAQADQLPKVLPLDSSPYGSTYGEWSARWWQWVMAVPAATNPNLDTTGANCGVGQVGPVWFLAGAFGGSFNRTCTVPAGKALLLTPLTQLNGSGAFDCEPTAPGLCNLNSLRALAAAFADNPTTLEVVVDGHRLKNVGRYRIQSPAFSITYPEGAVFGLPSGTLMPNVSDGYWLLLAPLSVGTHTITLMAVTNPEVGSFPVKVIWHLTITP